MVRFLASLFAVLASVVAMPATAQSLSLIAMPAVYVVKPIVQQTHREHATTFPAEAATPTPGFAAAQPQQFVSGNLPAWKAPHRVDRGWRDYNRGVAQYGPFRVIDPRTVALVGETDIHTPAAFRAMLRDFPGLEQLDMVECPGTQDDRANMKVGRMIRASGLVTHVPAIGSVRSGAVELFLAGVERDIANGAEFAVHSWMDEYGREARDFAVDAPENRQYVDYYREMGMSEREARAFYDFTNSVPHRQALWLNARDMRRWASPSGTPQARHAGKDTAPRIAYEDTTFS